MFSDDVAGGHRARWSGTFSSIDIGYSGQSMATFSGRRETRSTSNKQKIDELSWLPCPPVRETIAGWYRCDCRCHWRVTSLQQIGLVNSIRPPCQSTKLPKRTHDFHSSYGSLACWLERPCLRFVASIAIRDDFTEWKFNQGQLLRLCHCFGVVQESCNGRFIASDGSVAAIPSFLSGF